MKNLYLIWIGLLVASTSFAQSREYLYWVTGNKVEGRIVSVEDEDKLKTLLENGSTFYGGRDKILIAFNKAGSFLVVKDISTDANQAQRQIEAFYKEAEAPKNANDILLKAIPREVIACSIKNELEGAVNYLTTDGNPASINKDNLFAIIRRDGTHEVIRDVTEVVDNLSSMSDDFKRLREPQKVIEPPKPKPVTPTPKPIIAGPTEPEQKPILKDKKRLSSEEQRTYKAKSVEKMEELADLLNEIVDKKRSRDEKDEAIKKAVKMFTKEAKVEVSSLNNPNSKTNRPVAEYLDRLSRLNYSNVKITYGEIKFVEEFERDDQNNYWGMTSYSQTFISDNYSDITPKRQKIKLQRYEKIIDGVSSDYFNVLLGNISVDVKP